MPCKPVLCEYGIGEPVTYDPIPVLVPVPIPRKLIAFTHVPEGPVNLEPIDGLVILDTYDLVLYEAVLCDVLTYGVEPTPHLA